MAGKIYNALGDGNCAFNAFALALADMIVSGKLDGDSPAQKARQQKILALLPARQKNLTWENFKKSLQSLPAEQLTQFQRDAARALRANAIGQIKKLPAVYHEDTLPSLLAAFDDYLQTGNNIEQGDDIYRRHQFILDKFAALRDSKKDGAGCKAELTNWWKNQGGAEKFLHHMTQDGTYAGDMELAKIAQHLGLSFSVEKAEMPRMKVVEFHGEIPVTVFNQAPFKMGHVNALVTADIIEDMTLQYDGITAQPYKLLPKTRAELDLALNTAGLDDASKAAFLAVCDQYYLPEVPSIVLKHGTAHWDYLAETESRWPALNGQAAHKTQKTEENSKSLIENYADVLLKKYGEVEKSGTVILGKKAEELTEEDLKNARAKKKQSDEAFAEELQKAEVALYRKNSRR